ncbi:hypothetical protein HYALB_00003715 [Hymenoscyphus albidus]|uniref:Uncharacterized protein n=1 Tax=Hymenoscyphus albidus TaxID=595503 RepID=A0A9N9Q5R7_9HELO|nr:hypothetical protein HYALB_00003715 [Hymenoscyphus albidus]
MNKKLMPNLLKPVFGQAVDLNLIYHEGTRDEATEQAEKETLVEFSKVRLSMACVNVFTHAVQVKGDNVKPRHD